MQVQNKTKIEMAKKKKKIQNSEKGKKWNPNKYKI